MGWKKLLGNMFTMVSMSDGGSVASSVETDWVVRSAGASGDIIHISNW